MEPQHFAEMRRCLIDCDVTGARRLWKHVAPGMSQPKSDGEALATIHLARTCADYLPLKLRAYSHRWLVDSGYPSQLPDSLKPKAERLYPQIVDGVGIAVRGSGVTAPVAGLIRDVMSDAVMECYADKRTEPTFVRARMMEARNHIMKKLFGK